MTSIARPILVAYFWVLISRAMQYSGHPMAKLLYSICAATPAIVKTMTPITCVSRQDPAPEEDWALEFAVGMLVLLADSVVDTDGTSADTAEVDFEPMMSEVDRVDTEVDVIAIEADAVEVGKDLIFWEPGWRV